MDRLERPVLRDENENVVVPDPSALAEQMSQISINTDTTLPPLVKKAMKSSINYNKYQGKDVRSGKTKFAHYGNYKFYEYPTLLNPRNKGPTSPSDPHVPIYYYSYNYNKDGSRLLKLERKVGIDGNGTGTGSESITSTSAARPILYLSAKSTDLEKNNNGMKTGSPPNDVREQFERRYSNKDKCDSSLVGSNIFEYTQTVKNVRNGARRTVLNQENNGYEEMERLKNGNKEENSKQDKSKNSFNNNNNGNSDNKIVEKEKISSEYKTELSKLKSQGNDLKESDFGQGSSIFDNNLSNIESIQCTIISDSGVGILTTFFLLSFSIVILLIAIFVR